MDIAVRYKQDHFLCFDWFWHDQDLHSFPTRRSSDLTAASTIDASNGRPRLAQSAGISPAQRSASDRKSTRLNSSHSQISYAVLCLKKKKNFPTLSTLFHVPVYSGLFLLKVIRLN